VTGSSSGIGLATANLALQEGAKVFGVDISPPSEALTANENYKFLQCNVTDSTAPAEVVAKCAEVFGGRVDVLLNVAGVMDLFASADTVTDEMWDRCIAINLTAPVKLMREVLKVMKEQKSGSIVNVGSKAGTSGAAAGVAYTASQLLSLIAGKCELIDL
jgi:NAD(P)-dependent dehydrogenase (short-subunit alcohol dehydrogenase family)